MKFRCYTLLTAGDRVVKGFVNMKEITANVRILISGKAETGRSTVALILRRALAAAGIGCVIDYDDGEIRDVEKRIPQNLVGLRERHLDTPVVISFLCEEAGP